jgi:hypothetical protein
VRREIGPERGWKNATHLQRCFVFLKRERNKEANGKEDKERKQRVARLIIIYTDESGYLSSPPKILCTGLYLF